MIAGPLHRILFHDRLPQACAPVAAPEGRFHHSGQKALYAGLSAQAAAISITRYVAPSDPPRSRVELHLSGGIFFDATRSANLLELGFDSEDPMRRWDLDRAADRQPRTWALAEALRAVGFDGMVYPCRLDPSLTNIVVFQWNTEGGPTLTAGRSEPWRG